MKKKIKNNLSIKGSIRLFFVIFVLTITIRHFLTRSYFAELEKHQLILNLARQNSDIIEQIVIYAKQILDKRETAKALLVSDINRFDLNIDVLKNGGDITSDNQIKNLPPCDPTALPIVLEIEKIWLNYKLEAEIVATENTIKDSTITNKSLVEANDSLNPKSIISQSIIRVMNPRVQKAGFYVEKNMEALLSLNNQLNEKYLEILNEKKNNADENLWWLWGVNILLITLGFILIERLLLKPLDQIKKVAEKIGRGDLSQKVNYPSKNEVGLVALAINGMVDRIKNATNFIKGIEDGNLSVSYTDLNGISTEKDTLAGALINMRERMKTVVVEEQERNWTTKGLAIFGEILQKYTDNTSALSFEIISNLVKYMDANQGGLFIVDEEDGSKNVHLNLMACYAFNRRRFLEKQVAVGEGLVGQSFKDADTIYITEIPDNFVDITSGLGGTQPKSVLVVPLKLSDRVYGVIELASFYEFKPYQIAFLEKLSENIASNLYAARANEKTKKLLAESTIITEQMRLQEQETRKYLQALEIAQEEMQKNQEALAAQSFAIQSTLITIEMAMDRRILNVNDAFLQAFKYTYEEVIGGDHIMIVPQNQTIMKSYDRLWTDMRAGIYRTGEFKRVDKYGNEVWLRSTYTPVKDKSGLTYKIIQLAFDVTEDKKLRLDFKEQLDSFKRSSPVIEFSIDGIVLDVNNNFLDLMEYTREEIIGKLHTVIVPEEERYSKSYQALWHKLAQGHYHNGEVKRITKTGKEVWFQGSFNPILDLNGKPYKIIEFIIDITDRKNAEKRILAAKDELQVKESNLTALINNTDDAIYTIGTNYRVTMLNESAKIFFENLGSSLRISTYLLDALPKNYFHIWKGYCDRSFAGEKFSVEQAIFSETTNQKFYSSVYFNPIKDDQDRVIGVAIFSRDITNRKQRELDIAEFAKKQSLRTARIIETQKKAIVETSVKHEKEKLALEEKLINQHALLAKNQELINFLNKIESLAFTINQYYEFEHFNEYAKKIFKTWHIFIQPEYCLLDIFHEKKFEEWKALCDSAFDGESFSMELAFPNRHLHKVFFYVLSFLPIKNKNYQVTHFLISAKDMSEIRQKNRKDTLAKKKAFVENYLKSLKLQHIQLEKQDEVSINIEPKEKTQESQQIEIKEILTDVVEVAFKLDKDLCIKEYNSKAKEIFRMWRLYLQPDYYLPDIFPMENFDAWKAFCIRALEGEQFTVNEVFVNLGYKKIFIFNISFNPVMNEQNELDFIEVQAKDISSIGRKKLKKAQESVHSLDV